MTALPAHDPVAAFLGHDDLPTPELLQVTQQADALVGLMHQFFARMDGSRVDEFHDIAAAIARTKAEIRDIRPVELTQNRLPQAGAELEAIIRDTEGATNTLMSAAEHILEMHSDDPVAKTAIDAEVMRIFEACSFQDITGQRVVKIIRVLTQIEERIGRLVSTLGPGDGQPVQETAEERRRRELILHGPAIDGPETAQDEIDSLFAEPAPSAPEPVTAPEPEDTRNSQDDIDALFV